VTASPIIREAAYLGIDPGRRGAVVAISLDGQRVIYARRADGPDGYWSAGPRQTITPADLDAAIAPVIAWTRHAVLEEVGWYVPGGRRLAPSTAGKVGIQHGIWRGLMFGLRVPFSVMGPREWRAEARIMQVPGSPKLGTIMHVRRYLPDLDLTPGRCSMPHDGLADAAGMALAARAITGRLAAAL